MIRVSVDVLYGVIRFRAAVWAESIEQALAMTGARYPGSEARVVFPIDPETFFAEDSAPLPGTIVLGAAQEKAGSAREPGFDKLEGMAEVDQLADAIHQAVVPYGA